MALTILLQLNRDDASSSNIPVLDRQSQ